jgi:hypothetical protein
VKVQGNASQSHIVLLVENFGIEGFESFGTIFRVGP